MKKYGYHEVRIISAEDLRALCIKEDWYTCGDNEEYDHLLLDLAGRKHNITTDDIVDIATDIIEHSDLDISEDGLFEAVAYKVANIARVFIRPDF